MKQPELSIVIPFLNEAKVLPLLRERLEKLADPDTAVAPSVEYLGFDLSEAYIALRLFWNAQSNRPSICAF